MKSLKAGIIVNVGFLLLLAVGLTDLVLLQVTEQKMIEQHLGHARGWIRQVVSGADFPNPRDSLAAAMERASTDKANPVSCMLVGGSQNPEIIGSIPESLFIRARSFHSQALASGRPAVGFAGRIWGVFWPRSRYAMIFRAIADTGTAITAVVPLSPVYSAMRETQKMAAGYLLLNFGLLFLLGAWRLSRMMTRPIHRLIGITDAYRSSEYTELFPERSNDEFRKLSSALNRMLRRIEADRSKLRASLTSLENSNRQLREAKNEIVRAEKLASIGRLSAGLAHEIGNPVGIVLGYLGLLKSRSIQPGDKLGMDYIQRAEAEIQRVNTIIRQLLDFSRSRPADFSTMSLHGLLREVGGMLSDQPLFDGIAIEYELSAETDRIYGDPDQFRQVMVNLMINAADSIRQSVNAGYGRIQIVTRNIDAREGMLPSGATGDALELRVMDNGTGIPEEHLEKIFDPFFTTKETGKGTGLGLSVSYMIIEQMGGTIHAESRQPAGTEMIVRLPVFHHAGRTETTGSSYLSCENTKGR